MEKAGEKSPASFREVSRKVVRDFAGIVQADVHYKHLLKL
jgi:hypothetical protein